MNPVCNTTWENNNGLIEYIYYSSSTEAKEGPFLGQMT